jgi:hypothetical protein
MTEPTSTPFALGVLESRVVKPLEGLNVVLVCPTYGPVDPACARDLRVAVMSASAIGVHWAGDASPDRLAYGAARNQAAQAVRRKPQSPVVKTVPIDGIMWVDSDIRMQPDAIVRLLSTVKVHSLDFVTGIYHSRYPPYLPVIYHRVPETGSNGTKSRYLQCIDYPKETILSLDACGFGFVYTSTKLINGIADSPDFTKRGGWFPDRRDHGGFGEDIAFGDLAWRAGFQLYVDTGVQVGHTGDPKVSWEADFRAQGINIDSPCLKERDIDPDWGSPVQRL